MNWIHTEAYENYMRAFRNHKFSGDTKHMERNHRVSEAVIMCMRAGIEVRPYMLPVLQLEEFAPVKLSKASMYLAKNLKKLGEMELNKTIFTRMVGALFVEDTCYALYNTQNAVMKWSGGGEIKTCQSLTEIARVNINAKNVHAAILFGQSEDIALKTLIESDTSRGAEYRFDHIYRYIHFIPMNEFGVRQLRIFSVPGWKERLLDILFESEVRSYDRGAFEYDAYINGIYVYSHLDSDIARLTRFKFGAQGELHHCEVLCYPQQMKFLRTYLGSDIKLKIIDIKSIEEELGMLS